MTSAPRDGSFADEAFAVTADAYARAPEWELAIQAAIAALFGFLAGQPSRTRACVLADRDTGPAALARRDRAIDRFVGLLRPGFETTAAAAAPPSVVAEAIGGGIYELIRGHALELRLDELPDAAPNATIIALSPFIGATMAIELADAAGVRVDS